MKLFIRKKDRWINFIHNVDEMRQFEEAYIRGSRILIGDLSTFSRPMTNMLLKLIEDNPWIDCYSSRDLLDPVLISRFMEVVKEPLQISTAFSEEAFADSNKDYTAVETYLDLNNSSKLLAAGASKFQLSLLKVVSGRGY